MHVVRGGKRLLNTRHHLEAAELTEPEWRTAVAGRAPVPGGGRRVRQAVRQRDHPRHRRRRGLPQAPGAAGAPGERAARPVRARRDAWRSRTGASSGPTASPPTGPWPTASTKTQAGPLVPDRVLDDPTGPDRAAGGGPPEGVVGVDMNDDHLAAWRLDVHGNPVGEPQPLRLRPVRQRRAPRRAGPARPDPPAALHPPLRGRRDRHRGPRLHRGEEPGEARPPQTLPPPASPASPPPDSRPGWFDGRRTGHRHRRGRPGLHLPVGCPALAETPDHPDPQDLPARCGEPSRSGDAPSGTRSGDGRHRPRTPERCAGHRTVQARPEHPAA